MALKKSIGKLDQYYDRLENGKVGKIKASHVEKVITKLKAKEVALQEDIAAASKDSKKERLTGKLAVVREQIKRSKWLKKEIGA